MLLQEHASTFPNYDINSIKKDIYHQCIFVTNIDNQNFPLSNVMDILRAALFSYIITSKLSAVEYLENYRTNKNRFDFKRFLSAHFF